MIANGLFLSGWQPPRTPNLWHRTSIGFDNATRFLKPLIDVTADPIVDALAWLDRDDNLRLLIVHLTSGKRVTLRLYKKRLAKLIIDRVPERFGGLG